MQTALEKTALRRLILARGVFFWPWAAFVSLYRLYEVEYAFQSAIAAVQTASEDYRRRLVTVFASPRCPKAELPEAPRGLAKWKQAIEVVICNCKNYVAAWHHIILD